MTKTLSLAAIGVLAACSNSPVGQNDASTDASGDATQEAAVVTCTTPGAACPTGGKCFFAVGDCSATTGVCADDSFCASAGTESVCGCDNSQPVVPKCGPGGYALAKAAHFGPCAADAAAE